MKKVGKLRQQAHYKRYLIYIINRPKNGISNNFILLPKLPKNDQKRDLCLFVIIPQKCYDRGLLFY